MNVSMTFIASNTPTNCLKLLSLFETHDFDKEKIKIRSLYLIVIITHGCQFSLLLLCNFRFIKYVIAALFFGHTIYVQHGR